MHVKMLIGKLAGQIQEVPNHVGQSLVMMGQAEEVKDEEEVEEVEEDETATAEPQERAVVKRRKSGKRK